MSPGPDHEPRGRTAEAPSEIPARGWIDIARRVREDAVQDNVVLAAGGVAYYAFMSLIPALAAMIALYGLVVTPDQAEDRVRDLFGVLPSEARDLLEEQVRAIAGASNTGLSITAVAGVLLSLWAASSGVSHLMRAVNQSYDEPHDRKFLAQRGLALVLTLGAIVGVALAVTVLAVLPRLAEGWPVALRWLVQGASWALVAVLFLAGLAALYRYAPERDDPEWRWVTPGALLALVLWLAASLGLRLYAATVGSYNETYGALAGVVLLLLWLFVSALVVLLAAEVNAEVEHQTAIDTTVGPDEPMGERDARMADTLGAARG